MERVVVPESRRGRKRKVNNVQNAEESVGGRKKVMHTRSFELVGRYVQKEFKGSGVILGRIMGYDSGLYRINYEGDRCEDLISSKVKSLLVEDCDLTDEWPKRKEMLNEFLSSKDVNMDAATATDTRKLGKANPIDSLSLSGMTNSCSADDGIVKVQSDGSGEVDADSSSGSCESARGEEAKLDKEVPLVPPPELPPSSGHIGVPEECVPHLLSVYSFLRSFSVRLFLYPFALDDFVGALNCSVANTLLDSVHVALMCFLKRQFERIHSDGSGLASKVLRSLDWSLLDTLTWPIYLVHYLMVLGHKNGDDWKELYAHCLERDYYTLSVDKKLITLQILCDDVLDTEELRAEIDMREASEVGMEIDMSTVLGACEPARVIPGDSETSNCKDIEAAQRAENHQTRNALDNPCMESQVGGAVEDGNGDECRLCGMDGVLVCCDGCPSAYHSRCLGLNKMLVSNGSWYCPECKVNENDPKILRGTTLRGGSVFGVDPYGQVFVASCDHLLVVKTSVNSGTCPRYYNRHHIPGVLNALYANPDYTAVYSEICRGIMQYWELSADILPSNRKSGIGLELANKEGSGSCIAQLVDMLDKIPEMTEVHNHGTCATRSSAEMAGSWLTNCVLSDSSFDNAMKSDCHAGSVRQQCEILKTTVSEPASSSSLMEQPANPCESSQRSNSNTTEAVSTRSSNISSLSDSSSLEAKGCLVSQELDNRVGITCGSPARWCLYKGSSFNTTGYINHYLHGDFSASAAANLAILSHEKNQVLESQQAVCISIADQVKAFSSAAVRFFWPNVDKKLAEVPRERCSWCFSCKASVTSKKACLLNAAASNATRGVMKVLAGIRPVKNGRDERLSGIAAYIMFMEESLSGLLVGPFLNDTFRKQWRRQLEQATTCSEIKIILLELEENMRSIAFSGDWMKHVEGFSTQSSTSEIATGSTQKCRPGRRGKKRPDMVEVVADGFLNKSTKFTWWRGGIMSKFMFQRGILPSSMIKKPARQGGRKKIPGVRYVEGNEIPSISRQLVWRSAVEICRTVADLALQVRYLDLHVRWGDLGRPEQMPGDGKNSEAESSAFRNAFVHGKKIVEHEVRYCVAFGSRKHLPSRVMKNIAQTEQILEGGKERYWFSETFIPLYLIREYEQKAEKANSVNVLSKLQRRQLKASREKIFSVLFSEQGNTVRNCCSCHQDVFYRNAAKCHACQGFCHQQCATTSTVNKSKGNDFLVIIICKQCCETQAATQVDSSSGSPTSPLLPRVPDIPKPAISKDVNLVPDVPKPNIPKDVNIVCHNGSSINRSAVTKKNARSNWGLIWRKKYSEDTGFDFRSRNILLSGNMDRELMKPVCRLCDQPYNSGVMYIRCEPCKNWFHADALELDESQIFSLVGFKCCKCRRIKSPVCPYSNLQKRIALKGKIEHRQPSKLKIPAMAFNRDMILAHPKEVPTASRLPRKPEAISASANNPLLASPYKADPEPRKLPVRRHANREIDVHCPEGAYQFEASSPFEENAVNSTQETPMVRSTRKETKLATNSFRDEVTNPTEANPAIPVQDSLPRHQFASQDFFDLESNVGVHVDSKGPPSVPRNGTPESFHDQDKLIESAETSNKIVPCKFCSKPEPCTDLSCEICGITIHKTCSPWYESSSNENGWRCGSCRDWS
ncbi:DDT domain-containing protein PTM-like isoform X2 [Salvia miltiorrhiza]|uniref:DDT domain-containing protein PTM-like isoform X2 n=1 Tax=Salvia miltiorrhiza TaxID=226208 RepID=UPI0025AC4CC5|nr:DDT domain-containing protein PTM-like isoform X2 [Salvia miltiorrhiza]